MNRLGYLVSLRKLFCISIFMISAILLLPRYAQAAVPVWSIVPGESHLSFTGTQNNAPITGQFKKFTGDIHFSPDELQASHVKIIVDISSVSFSYKDIEDTLKMPDWFNVKLFPQAVFEASDFSKISENHYQAKGSLTIRDKTLPLVVDFTKASGANNKVKITGTAMLKRTAFGVGAGEWASTDEVKDDVKVNFILTAIKKP